jgi:hypothetical protein
MELLDVKVESNKSCRMPNIQKPCPVSLRRMSKIDDKTYYCKSCNLNVYDFTALTKEELSNIRNKKVCGIFTSNQLDDQPEFKWYKKIIFKTLTILSFLGFSVSPVQADSYVQNNDITIINESQDKQKLKPKLRKKKRKNRKVERTKGTPTWL